MEVYQQLFSKNGIATVKLAKEFIRYSIGQRIPTVTEFCYSLDLVRGTVQNGIKNLVDSGAIRVESKGHLGSYLVKKNTSLLLKYAGITSVTGAMPLPYSKRYEGLASGLIVSMENAYNLSTNLAYMRGSKNRIFMLLENRYEFAVVSKYAAQEFIKEKGGIKIALSFGKGSFVSKHVIMFNDHKKSQIEDGMKIGVDFSSLDQLDLVKQACGDKKVELVPYEYSLIAERVALGEVDATVMSIDEIENKKLNIKCVDLPNGSTDTTEAVVVIRENDATVEMLIKQLIDIDTVLNVQNLVYDGKINPSY